MKRIYQECDASGNWTTYRADGSVLSTAADLQPGINEAQATGYPLVVDGNANHKITAPAVFGPASYLSYTLRNVRLEYTGPNQAVILDTLFGCELDWKGSIGYSGPSLAVWVAPKTLPPIVTQTYPITEFATIRIPFIYALGGTPYALMLMDPTHGAIVNDYFYLAGLYGSNLAMNGIVMGNPPNGLNGMAQNIIDFNLVAGCKATAIQEGTGPIDPLTQPLGTNIWRGAITSDYAMYSGYQTFGVMSQAYFSSISVNSGTIQHGVYFCQGSQGNYVVSPQIQATTYVVDQGTNNKCVKPPY